MVFENIVNVIRIDHQNFMNKKVTHLEYSYLKNEVLGEQPEYIRVPFSDINCLSIPNHVPDDKDL